MGRRGPPKKPTALKRLQGNPGKRPLPKDEPAPPPADPKLPDSMPVCPDFLDEAARAEWAEIVPQLVELKVLARLDRAALAAYCQAWSRWRMAELLLAGDGLTYMSATGVVKKHPAIAIAAEAQKLMRQFLIEFGLTPAARARLRLDHGSGKQKDEGEGLDAVMGRRPQMG